MKKFSVWVGGVEVNDFYLTLEQAQAIADDYKSEGYDDVVVEEVKGERNEHTV
jgi:hypothetical protein